VTNQLDDWLSDVIITASADPRAGVEREIYAAVFDTDAGRAVLADLVRRYIAPSRFVPGEAESFGFYREGAASVVHEILDLVMGEEHGDQESRDGGEG
jgi:hypothetical protein